MKKKLLNTITSVDKILDPIICNIGDIKKRIDEIKKEKDLKKNRYKNKMITANDYFQKNI